MTGEAKMKNVSSKKATPKKKKIASLDRRKARAGWFFVAPFLIGFILLYLPIVVESIIYSFQRIHTIQGGGFYTEWVGWANYQEALFVDPDFVSTLLKGLQSMAFDIPMIILFSLFMAVLLNQKMVGRAVFRAIFFIPVILATGLMEGIEASNILSEYMESAEGIEDGSGQSSAADIVSAIDIQRLFANMKVGQELVEYVTVAINNIYDIVNRSGVQLLIFLAGLQSISPAIYESCQIDGATSWETFWKITFPMISPMILVNTVYTVIDAFTSQSNSVIRLILGTQQQPIAAAMAWVYFLIVIVLIGAVTAFVSSFVFYQRRD